MAKPVLARWRGLKLTQKIFFVFILLLFLIINSWAFTITTFLDFQAGFTEVETYALPTVLTTATLKDNIHRGLLAVYSYVTTGEATSKTTYETAFTSSATEVYNLFLLSQTNSDFEFTQQFNEKFFAVFDTADQLIATYEANPTDPAIKDQLTLLNTKRDEFSTFLETTVNAQVQQNVATTEKSLQQTANTIRLYVVVIIIVIIAIIGWLFYFVSNNLSKPLRQLTTAAHAFGEGNFKPVQIHRNDELGLFAETFNTMAEHIQASQLALQEELTKTKALDRQKSEFLSIAAHQLRTPMAGIRWVAQMLYDGDMGKLNTEQRHHLGNGLENINRMIHLINDLLDVAKIEEQKFQYKFQRQDLRPVVQEVIQRMQHGADTRSITLRTEFIPNDTLLAWIDKDKIDIVFNNLLDNAIKYSADKTEIVVHVEQRPNGIQCFVQDHGLGIPAASQGEVFNKFFRAPNVLKVVTEGSGLGLFIVKDIIAKHDGKIWFESTEQVGTTFYFFLPDHPAEPK